MYGGGELCHLGGALGGEWCQVGGVLGSKWCQVGGVLGFLMGVTWKVYWVVNGVMWKVYWVVNGKGGTVSIFQNRLSVYKNECKPVVPYTNKYPWSAYEEPKRLP